MTCPVAVGGALGVLSWTHWWVAQMEQCVSAVQSSREYSIFRTGTHTHTQNQSNRLSPTSIRPRSARRQCSLGWTWTFGWVVSLAGRFAWHMKHRFPRENWTGRACSERATKMESNYGFISCPLRSDSFASAFDVHQSRTNVKDVFSLRRGMLTLKYQFSSSS